MHGYKFSYIAVQIKLRNTLLTTERLVAASEGRMSYIAERQFTNRRSERLVRPRAGRLVLCATKDIIERLQEE